MTLCSKCHQPLPDRPAYPQAIYLSLQTVGRQVFAVEGRPGLWIRSGQMNGGIEMDESVQALIKAGKGRTSTLYRQRKLEDELRAAMG
jgi:hypothetical protein